MPSINPIARGDLTSETARQYFELLFGPERDPLETPGTSTGTPGDWWPVFALSDDIFEHAVDGFKVYRSPDRNLDPILRELGQTRAGWIIGSQFVYSQHCKSLRGLGVSEEKIAAVHCWTVSDVFDDKERAVLAYADCLAAQLGRVPDEVTEKLKSFLSDVEILELSYITTLYIMHAILSRALKTGFDDRPDPIIEVAAPEDFNAADFLGGSRRTE